MDKPIDKEKALLQAVWRKAQSQSKPLTLHCGTNKQAQRMRFALYNAVRKVRAGKEPADSVLLAAVENLSVVLGAGGVEVTLQHKVLKEHMEEVLRALELTPEEALETSPVVAGVTEALTLRSSEELQEAESLALVMQKLGSGAPEPEGRQRLDYAALLAADRKERGEGGAQ